MARKTRRIEIKKIANQQSKYVTFSKRRSGLFKKAQEACKEFNIEIGIVIISPANIVYECDENTRNVVDRFLSYNHRYQSLSEAEVDDQLGDLEAIEAQLRNMVRDDKDDDLDLALNLNSNLNSNSGSEVGITEEEVNSILDEYLRH